MSVTLRPPSRTLVDPFAAVNRNHEGTLGDKREALRLVKEMTGQMKGSVVLRGSDAFKEIEVELIARNGTRDL